MPSYDIARYAFDPRTHFSGVRMQQGKPLLEEDFNEAFRIENELLRRAEVDIIGGYGSPDDGFRIINWNPAGPAIDFDISPGAIYLGGHRWEMERAIDANGSSVRETFRLQRDWLQKDDNGDRFPAKADLPDGRTRYDLVYLSAWRQPVCAVEDEALVEKAIGIDSSTRLRNNRQVGIFAGTDSPECAILWKELRESWTSARLGTVNRQYERISNTKLSVSFTGGPPPENPCTPSVAGGYLGAENQAIRVQLVDPGSTNIGNNDGLFTWGFDNAAPLYRVELGEQRTVIHMLTTPKDQYHWPQVGQTVEILAWSAVLPNGEKIAEQSGFLTTVSASYDPDSHNLSLTDALTAGFGENWMPPAKAGIGELKNTEVFFFMRVWNRGTDRGSPATIGFRLNTPVTLGNTGLQVTIAAKDTTKQADLVPEDFWIIGVRPSTPDKLTPWELKAGKGIPPAGPRRFFAPLAVIEWTADGQGAVTGKIIHDCRRPFQPLTADECCCTYSVGDGVRTRGDFNSIQEAVDALPAEGGKICILGGIHTANVIIRGAKQVLISGCGDQTLVRPDEKFGDQAIFRIEHSQRITIENMVLVSLDGSAVEVVDDEDREMLASREITVRNTRILALVHAVNVHLQDTAGDKDIRIIYNLIGMFDKEGADVAIFSRADGVLIERNRIVVIPPPVKDPPPGGPEQPPGDVHDPCADLKRLYAKDTRFRALVRSYLKFVSIYRPGTKKIGYLAKGAIQIGCGSEKVWIIENEVIGGNGYGILLGHREEPPPGAEIFEFTYPPIKGLKIDGNLITQMGLGGIGPFVTSQEKEILSAIEVDDFRIFQNTITTCALQITRDLIQQQLAFGGIVLSFATDGNIAQNQIKDNGRSQLFPICGIYIQHAENIDITGNHVMYNGPQNRAGDDQAFPGNRGGIVIRSAYKPPSALKTDVGLVMGFNISKANFIPLSLADADPGIKIENNVVTQSLGQALLISAFGPVAVVGNQFTSQGVYERDRKSTLGACVCILNTGVSKDLMEIVAATKGKFRSLLKQDPTDLFSSRLDKLNAFSTRESAMQLLPSGKVLFVANQTMLDMRSPETDVALAANLIVSMDDVSFTSNQAECASLVLTQESGAETTDRVKFNTLLLAISLRCNDNRFTDGYSFVRLSLYSLGLVNTTTDNQATHCIRAIGFPQFLKESNNTVIKPANCKETALKLGAGYWLQKNEAVKKDDAVNKIKIKK